MEVSFILVNYNTHALLLKAIASIVEYTGISKQLSYEVIVVDNASSLSPEPFLSEKFPAVKLLQAPSNQGFGAANNLAMQIAKGKYYFFLNPDAFLTSDAASYFIEKMESPMHQQMAFCSGELINESGSLQHCFGNFPTIIGGISACGLKFLYPSYYRKHLSLGVANYDDQPKKVDYVSGAAFMVPKALVDKYGGFDEDFFLYFEETEWAYRLKQKGYYSMIFPYIKIIHIEGGSTVVGTNAVFSRKNYQWFAESRQLFYKKTKGSFFAAIMKPIDLFYELLKTLNHREIHLFFTKLMILWKA